MYFLCYRTETLSKSIIQILCTAVHLFTPKCSMSKANNCQEPFSGTYEDTCGWRLMTVCCCKHFSWCNSWLSVTSFSTTVYFVSNANKVCCLWMLLQDTVNCDNVLDRHFNLVALESWLAMCEGVFVQYNLIISSTLSYCGIMYICLMLVDD